MGLAIEILHGPAAVHRTPPVEALLDLATLVGMVVIRTAAVLPQESILGMPVYYYHKMGIYDCLKTEAPHPIPEYQPEQAGQGKEDGDC
jgi:hypothetical protein